MQFLHLNVKIITMRQGLKEGRWNIYLDHQDENFKSQCSALRKTQQLNNFVTGFQANLSLKYTIRNTVVNTLPSAISKKITPLEPL